MGTRNLTEAKIDGELKVSQYGQWDGYPTGQGYTIADFLKEVDLDSFKEELKKIRKFNDEEEKELDNDPDWKLKYPHMSRDAGADVLNMIARGEVKFVGMSPEFKEDTLFCEYYYLLDFDKETVSVNGGKEYKFSEWTRELMDQLEEANNDDE